MIRLAKLEDVDYIMEFIHNEWKENHILSRDKAFFLYEHQHGLDINFVISTNTYNKINGLLGFIPTSFNSQIDAFTVIWKVSKNTGNAILGLQLLEYLRNLKKIRTIMSLGINEKTTGIYTYLQMYTDVLNHFVLINPNLSSYTIAKVPKQYIKPYTFIKGEGYEVKVLNRDFQYDFNTNVNTIPFKDELYFKKRYYDHPIYKYKVYGIFNNGLITSLVVTRIQNANNSKVLRVVDYIGNESDLKYVSEFFFNLLNDRDLEYADFYCYGFDAAELTQAGFIQVDQDSDDLIIPNYFQPFVRKNIKINFFSNSLDLSALKLFKADGDQDRPS
jgi:hypothetical protein